jgi:hypothetical protein
MSSEAWHSDGALNTEFVGDTRLFSAKYPSDPYDGWLGSLAPVMPTDVLKPLLAKPSQIPRKAPRVLRYRHAAE